MNYDYTSEYLLQKNGIINENNPNQSLKVKLSKGFILLPEEH